MTGDLSRKQKEELVILLEEQARRKKESEYKGFFSSLYDWQKEFIASTSTHTASCLCAANQIGKTYTGTGVDAIHLLGEYPDEWEGHKFEHPPRCWLLGYSGEKTRDLLQSVLFGRMEGQKLSGGLIPASRIVDYKSMQGTTGAFREVRVKHASGGVSVCQFWSYSQGQHALMGDVVDWYHIDEEPKDQDIYPQVLTRTINGDNGRGGRGILTFTPENGRTELVVNFMDDPAPNQFFMRKGWDDAPHMDEEVKKNLLASYPKHQRDMRTKGIPMLGHGRIYDFSEDFLVCDSFEIPAHFFVINGMDFGWDHPQAHIQLAIDRDNGMYYVTRAHSARQTLPSTAWDTVKRWADGVPTAWPHDGLQTEKGSGIQQKTHYEEAGFEMLHERATWTDGSNSVEAGLFEIRELMQKGQFKVFAGLRNVLDELLQYHRNDKGKIAKVGDDLVDAIRYAYMMEREAITMGSVGDDTSTSLSFASEF